MIVWIMGLTGAGKTSTAKALSEILRKNHKENIILDGNHLRSIFAAKGYDKASRIALGIKYANLAKALSADKIVIIAANGMLNESSKYCREFLRDYIEVFLNMPKEVLIKRDSQGIYSKFQKGEIKNVGGLDLSVDTPKADLEIKYDKNKNAAQIAQKIYEFLEKYNANLSENLGDFSEILSTKAQSLKNLSKKIKTAKILPIWTIKYSEFLNEKCFENLKNTLEKSGEKAFIVRSSCKNEDTQNASNAGAFLSLANIKIKELKSAVKRVFESYKSVNLSEEEILIQPLAKDIKISGVAFNYHPKTFAPYFVIEFAPKATDAVTSGQNARQFISSHFSEKCENKDMEKVILLLKELGKILPKCPLDIEFGLNSKGEIYLFQARKLIINATPQSVDISSLKQLESKINTLLAPRPFLCGDGGILAVMSDWNPAEIIGLHPRTLSFSLYKELITDEIWAKSRASLGYKNVVPNLLMYDLSGFAYVDVRASFNSFVPRNLSENLSQKLVNFYLNKLRQNPNLHDKIEFEIVLSCYDFSSEARLKELKKCNFSENEIKEIKKALQGLTRDILVNKPYLEDIKNLEILAQKRQIALNLKNSEEAIFWLLKDCKIYGTKSFANLARMGFMAVSFLNSLIALKIINKAQKDSFINSLNGLASQFNKDFKTLNKAAFLTKYGHLRPGTYDILSPRYDEDFKLYFGTKKPPKSVEKTEFKLSLKQIKNIEDLLKKSDFKISVLEFFDFIAMGIMQREFAKFEFSKNLSEILRLIAKSGAKFGLNKEDMSFCEIGVFIKAFGTSENIEALILENIQTNRLNYAKQKGIILPALITNSQDIYSFFSLESMPNFITQKRVRAEVLNLSTKNTKNLSGKIIAINAADPGFEWIFSHDIKGLITEFGGANSHMAIRANELGLPAVIGCGKRFSTWSEAAVLDIDCANNKVEIV